MTDLRQLIEGSFERSRAVKQEALERLLPALLHAAERLIAVYRGGGKALFCGNGGSAADAQHLAAELVGRFQLERQGLPALALTVNTSVLTAIGNDYSYADVFARQVEALARPGDALVGLSTSGNSANVIEAFRRARTLGLTTIALTGRGGGKLREFADILLDVPSIETPRIQECHTLIGHCLCEAVERAWVG